MFYLSPEKSSVATYIVDFVKFRYRATAQWTPKLVQVRKKRCEANIQVWHANGIPVYVIPH